MTNAQVALIASAIFLSNSGDDTDSLRNLSENMYKWLHKKEVDLMEEIHKQP